MKWKMYPVGGPVVDKVTGEPASTLELFEHIEELEEWQRQMIEKAADESLDGYRDAIKFIADAREALARAGEGS